MAALLNPDGRQVVDVNGKNLKIGSLVTDDMFGECFTKGTVVLDRGEGFNVLVDWRQPKDKEGLKKPVSRGASHLTLVEGTARTTNA